MNPHDNYRWKERASVCSKPSMVARDGSCHRQSTSLLRHRGCLHRITDERSRNRLPYRAGIPRDEVRSCHSQVDYRGPRGWHSLRWPVCSRILADRHRPGSQLNAAATQPPKSRLRQRRHLDLETREHARVRTWADGTTRSPGAIAQFAMVSRRRISL
jgi:hypothetical protein